MSGTLDYSVSPSAEASTGLFAKERTTVSARLQPRAVPPAVLF
jgi:hypothetical protein